MKELEFGCVCGGKGTRRGGADVDCSTASHFASAFSASARNLEPAGAFYCREVSAQWISLIAYHEWLSLWSLSGAWKWYAMLKESRNRLSLFPVYSIALWYFSANWTSRGDYVADHRDEESWCNGLGVRKRANLLIE